MVVIKYIPFTNKSCPTDERNKPCPNCLTDRRTFSFHVSLYRAYIVGYHGLSWEKLRKEANYTIAPVFSSIISELCSFLSLDRVVLSLSKSRLGLCPIISAHTPNDWGLDGLCYCCCCDIGLSL